MKKLILLLCICTLNLGALAQNPDSAPLPARLQGLEKAVVVDHFPAPVLASKDAGEPGTYFWKHTTSLLSPGTDLRIEEGGAFIFVGGAWQLRVSLPRKAFSKLFHIPKGRMKAGEPYTFVKNWRGDARLLAGTAMWYVIGRTAEGKRVAGWGKLELLGELYPNLEQPSN